MSCRNGLGLDPALTGIEALKFVDSKDDRQASKGFHQNIKQAVCAGSAPALPAALRKRGAAPVTIEALMHSLRQRGERALAETDCQRRLSELSEEQLREVAVRLQKLKTEIAPAWTPAQVEVLVAVWKKLND